MADLVGDSSPASRLIYVDVEVRRIVLTGFMGAGKSTVGRLLADRTGWELLDLDTHIETTTGKNARELFDVLGESGFRQLESDLWGAVLQRSRAIISPGGAVIDKLANQSVLHRVRAASLSFSMRRFRRSSIAASNRRGRRVVFIVRYCTKLRVPRRDIWSGGRCTRATRIE